MPEKIEVSHRTIIFTVIFLLLLWFLYQIRQVLLIFFIGLILMAALNPIVERLGRFRIPRPLAIILIYILIFGAFGLLLAGLIPALINETGSLFSRLAENFSSLQSLGIDGKTIEAQGQKIISNFGSLSLGVIRTVGNIFGNVFVFLIILVVGFYLLMERKKLDQDLVKLFGAKSAQRIERIVDRVEDRLGKWVRAEVILMIIIGALNYIGFRILGINYALVLAILAGFLEVIPNIGPVVAAIPAVLVGLSISPWMGVAVAAWSFLVQQLENQFLVPQIMAKAVGLNPLVTIFALIAGFNLAGVGGAFLSLPIVLLAGVILSDVYASKSK